jgi:Uncharacterized conserved protein
MPINLYLPETLLAVVSLRLDDYAAALDSMGNAGDFISLTRDKDEVTLIISESEWARIAHRFPMAQVQTGRRMIVFDTVLDFTVVGFIAEISRALAEAGISILNVSTYTTDIVLVHESKFDAAVVAVKQALVTLHFTYLSQQ